MTKYRIEGTALVARGRYARRAIYRDSYQPTRLWQRGSTVAANGWVLRLPHGSLWLMVLGRRPAGWVHQKETP